MRAATHWRRQPAPVSHQVHALSLPFDVWSRIFSDLAPPEPLDSLPLSVGDARRSKILARIWLREKMDSSAVWQVQWDVLVPALSVCKIFKVCILPGLHMLALDVFLLPAFAGRGRAPTLLPPRLEVGLHDSLARARLALALV